MLFLLLEALHMVLKIEVVLCRYKTYYTYAPKLTSTDRETLVRVAQEAIQSNNTQLLAFCGLFFVGRPVTLAFVPVAWCFVYQAAFHLK